MKHVSLAFILRFGIVILLGALLVNEILTTFTTASDATALASEAVSRAGTDSRTQSLRSLKALEADDVARLDKVVVTEPKLVGVISQIEDTGKSLGLTVNITSINGGEAASSTPYDVHMAISTSGSWGASLSFLHLLESLPYKASLDGSELVLAGKVWQGSETLTMTLLPE